MSEAIPVPGNGHGDMITRKNSLKMRTPTIIFK